MPEYTPPAGSGGGGGASTLDDAYDGGGSGAGRTITADAGDIEISSGGDLRMTGTGNVQIEGGGGLGVGGTPDTAIHVDLAGSPAVKIESTNSGTPQIELLTNGKNSTIGQDSAGDFTVAGNNIVTVQSGAGQNIVLEPGTAGSPGAVHIKNKGLALATSVPATFDGTSMAIGGNMQVSTQSLAVGTNNSASGQALAVGTGNIAANQSMALGQAADATSYASAPVIVLNNNSAPGGGAYSANTAVIDSGAQYAGPLGAPTPATLVTGNTGTGNVYLQGGGVYSGSADYAEMFEWVDGNPDAEDRRGLSVVLEDNKIRAAVAGEDPIGVISANPTILGDAAWNKWTEKHLRDDFGSYVLEEHNVIEWTDEEGKEHNYEDWNIPTDVVVPDDAVITTHDANGKRFSHRALNPAYDPDQEYIPREERQEWDAVGLMGKLRIRKGQVTGARWIKMRDISDNVEEWLVR